jgi:alpha-tubulin suppressor-like RCC1 family protein
MFLDGTLVDTASSSTSFVDPSDSASIGRFSPNDNLKAVGIISNLRFIKGTALHTSSFNPPFYELTNVTNTKLLCCQSNSSTTTAAVTPGTITATGDPTASAQTITSSSSVTPSITWPDRVKWNGGTTPTLVTNNYAPARQIFRLTTVDTGLNYNAWEEIVYNVEQPNQLWSWGSNTDTAGSYGYAGSLGQNNQGAPTDRSSPVQVGTDTNWSEITFSNSVTALKSDGTLWAWGNGSYGVAAQNDQTQRSSPTQIPGTTWSKLGKSQGGYGHVFAQKTDGTLWAWGYGAEGALGINNIVSYSSPVQLPGTTWSITSSDGRSSFGIKTDGTLWAWGYNQQGRLGLRPNIPSGQGEEMFSSPVQMAGNPGTGGRETGWVAVVPRMAMNSDGTLWAWGQDDNGQAGKNDNSQSLSMVQIPGTTWGQDMSKISTTGNNTGAIKQDGTLWVWGRNDNYGQLGQNNRTSRSSPHQIGTDTTWSSIHVGAMIMRATKTDGTLWTWGRNDDERKGNLGLSNVGVHRSSPTQIPGTSWSQKVGGMTGQASTQLTLKKSD